MEFLSHVEEIEELNLALSRQRDINAKLLAACEAAEKYFNQYDYVKEPEAARLVREAIAEAKEG